MLKRPVIQPQTETDRTSLILITITVLPGAFFWRNNTGALPDKTGRLVRFGFKGSADILGCYNGFFVALETKTLIGKQRPDQEKFERFVKSAGGIYQIVRCPEDAMQVMRQINPLLP